MKFDKHTLLFVLGLELFVVHISNSLNLAVFDVSIITFSIKLKSQMVGANGKQLIYLLRHILTIFRCSVTCIVFVMSLQSNCQKLQSHIQSC